MTLTEAIYDVIYFMTYNHTFTNVDYIFNIKWFHKTTVLISVLFHYYIINCTLGESFPIFLPHPIITTATCSKCKVVRTMRQSNKMKLSDVHEAGSSKQNFILRHFHLFYQYTKMPILGWAWCYMTVIPATWKEEIGRILVKGQSRQRVSATPS